ncbi:MAG: CotH kinase family protein [Bacteroidetes bacterium]|nr:CotH kinase family protein [Bacteroidota bacterium]
MKKLYILLLFFFYFLSNKAQVFVGTGGPVLNNGGQETPFTINVTGINQLDTVFGLEEIYINLNHAAVEEVQVYLQSPSGATVDLSGVGSCSGSNFAGTYLNSNVPNSITVGSAPYTGTFAPVGNIGRFNCGKPGTGAWKLFVKDFVAPANTGSLVSWSLRFSNAPCKPVNLISSNLPLVFINTNNQAISTNSILVDFGIVYNGSARNYITDPKNNFTGKAACHVRGSSSQIFEKKNLKIELRDAGGLNQLDASLLGMPAESDWVLTAGYTDKTLLRNAITQYVFQQMGHYSPRYKYVELIMNGEYLGVYLLMEKVKHGKDRVAIAKMTNLDNQFPYITGGYIVQINRTDNAGWYSYYPGVSTNSQKFYYQYVYPKDIDITLQQQAYIKSYVDSFEVAMQSPTFADPALGYKKYIDENSFIDFLILNELSKNVDAYRLSTYLYKDNAFDGGKLHTGPMWDYDLAWHNASFGNASTVPFWQYDNPDNNYPTPTWWNKLMQDVNFQNKLYCRYHTIRLNILSNPNLFAFIDQTAASISEGLQRNFRQFPIIGAYLYGNPQSQVGATYATEINDLKNWITNRAAWLDGNVPGFCNTIGLEEHAAAVSDFNIFPNPFANAVSIQFSVQQTSNIKIELFNLLGEKVMLIHNEKRVAGDYRQDVSTAHLTEGTYFLRMDIDGKSSYKKIIKI